MFYSHLKGDTSINRPDHGHPFCEHTSSSFPKVSVDSLVAKYGSCLKKAGDAANRLQRLLVVAESLLPALKRKNPERAKEFADAVTASRTLMLDSLEQTADLKGKSKERDGGDVLEKANDQLTKVAKECSDHHAALSAAMVEHKKELGEADGSDAGAGPSGGHLALVDVKTPASSPKGVQP